MSGLMREALDGQGNVSDLHLNLPAHGWLSRLRPPATNVGITPGFKVIPTGEASPRNQRQYNSEICYTDGASGPRNQRQYNFLVIPI